ncbi:hypothetical protein ABIB25_003121 [Nakamurella sp. UYEF19]|uniref:hypothetical protein n=1 Tax=Nakamurella sp. UYEF19 TaxID=1756392 RepID=UPI00339590DD
MTNTRIILSAPRAPRTWPRSLILGAAALAIAGTLVACSSSSSTATPAPAGQVVAPNGTAGATTGGAAGTGTGAGVAGGVRPEAYGSIAALAAGTLQVQNTTAQTTVKYTSATTFTETVKKAIRDVKVGSCVTAAAAVTQPTGTGSAPASGAAQAPTSRAAVTELTAATVLISQPVAGVCEAGAGGGFGGGAGTRPTGAAVPNGGAANGGAANGAVPSGASGAGGAGASGSGTAGRGNFGSFGERTSGTVTSISGSTIVVQETNRTTRATTKVTVTVNGKTAYTETAAAKSTALEVGLCAVAIGTADTTGAVAAKSIALSPAGATGCTSGFGAGGLGNRTGRQGGTNSGPVTTNG